MLKQYTTKAFCFSPPIMLATFVIEFFLAGYVARTYKNSTTSRLVIALLVFLGIFQVAEYMVCGGLGLKGVDWARIGYISITFLPPLGIHLATILAKKPQRKLVALAYASALMFLTSFVLLGGTMTGQECRPNYAVFLMPLPLVWVYSLYYYGWTLIATVLSLLWSAKSLHASQLKFLALGYASFIVPTTTINIIAPETLAGIPSVMCGFAVILAILLVLKILPGTTPRRAF
jgi:hypothetical protein